MDQLAERFEENRIHLRGVAYRMLGSRTDAEDAVQEAWLRLSRAGADGVDNLTGWLTTVVARVCLDMLRARKSTRNFVLLLVVAAVVAIVVGVGVGYLIVGDQAATPPAKAP